MLEPAPFPPINPAALDHAEREVSDVLAAAKRGHEASQRTLIQMAAAPALVVNLNRIAVAADKCAPSTDEIRINAFYAGDAIELRFAGDAAQDALSRAAGRAVVVTLPERASEEAKPEETGSAA